MSTCSTAAPRTSPTGSARSSPTNNPPHRARRVEPDRAGAPRSSNSRGGPMTDTEVRPRQTPEVPAHPLDPATGTEFLAGREILAAAGLLGDSDRFAYYGLAEPPKDEVLAGRPDRRLR